MRSQQYSTGDPSEKKFGFAPVVDAGHFVFTAGCVSTVDGEVVNVGDIEGQTYQAINNASQALNLIGARRANVVRTRLYVVNRADIETVGRIHAEVFAEQMSPALTLLVVAGLQHPDLLVQVEFDAYVGP